MLKKIIYIMLFFAISSSVFANVSITMDEYGLLNNELDFRIYFNDINVSSAYYELREIGIDTTILIQGYIPLNYINNGFFELSPVRYSRENQYVLELTVITKEGLRIIRTYDVEISSDIKESESGHYLVIFLFLAVFIAVIMSIYVHHYFASARIKNDFMRGIQGRERKEKNIYYQNNNTNSKMNDYNYSTELNLNSYQSINNHETNIPKKTINKESIEEFKKKFDEAFK